MQTVPTKVATPEEVLDAVNAALISIKKEQKSERRIGERVSAFLPLNLKSMDRNQEFIGEPFKAVTRDISMGGLGIISVVPIESPQILVNFEGTQSSTAELLMNVHYCYPIGPLFFTGASFCADWSDQD